MENIWIYSQLPNEQPNEALTGLLSLSVVVQSVISCDRGRRPSDSERDLPKTHIYSTTNFSHSHLVNILHISSSHDVKSESITEYDIYYNCSGRHIVLLSHAMQTFPSLLTLLLCSVVADLIICFQSFAFYDFSPSLSLFYPPPPSLLMVAWQYH